MTDLPENIWKLVQDGDKKSFELIYRKFYKQLCFYSFQITQKHDLTEELVNDFFLKIWTNREIINIRGSVKSYLFQSVHNLSLNLLKSQNTSKASVNQKATDGQWKFIEETYSINDFLVENIVAEETGSRIDKIIEGLPEQCREVFMLSRFKGKSNQEIAQEMNISESTVRVQIFRALSKITSELENYK